MMIPATPTHPFTLELCRMATPTSAVQVPVNRKPRCSPTATPR